MYTRLRSSAKNYKVLFNTEEERDEMLLKLKELNNGKLFRNYGNLSYLNLIPGREVDMLRRNGNFEADYCTDYYIEIKYFFGNGDITNLLEIEHKIEELILKDEG